MKKCFLTLVAITMCGCAPDRADSRGSAANLTATCPVTVNTPSNLGDIHSLSVVDGTYEHYIVKKKSTASASGLAASGTAVREYSVNGLELNAISQNMYSVKVAGNTPQEREQSLNDLASQEDVEYIEPDYPIYPIDEGDVTVASNDPLFAQQWSHKVVQSEAAWKVTSGSKDIVVAVVDSGIDYTHNDLKNNMWVNPKETVNGLDDDKNGFVDDVYGWNFVSNNASPKTSSTSNHGTHVAGIIGASGNNGIGTIGIAPNVKLMALKFIGENGSGFTSGAIQAIDYAIAHKVFAINNSWGSTSKSTALADAVTRAEKAGILFVVAAGNSSVNVDQTMWYPTVLPNTNVLAVAATTSSDSLASYSNYGLRNVDVAAPGSSILSTASNQSYVTMSGTSMAAPLVTGLAVLVKAANPKLDYQGVINVIKNSVDKKTSMTNIISAGGRVNALSAVKMATAGLGSAGEIARGCP